jgi:hypothetical protein
VSADRRRWALRAILLLPTYWLLRDTVRLHVSDYVSLVVIPWAVLVLASWLLARRAFDPGEARLRLVLAVVAAVCAWGVLQVGRMATRVVLVPSLLAAAACVAPPLGPAAAALGVLLAVLELALRLAPALLPVDARLALPLGARARLDCSFRAPDGCLPAEALQVFPPALAFAYRPGLDVVLWHREGGYWTLSTDQHGFANADPTLHDHADVVVLGDAFVQGVLVEPEESFPARLAARTGRRVLNLGVDGWDAHQYPIALRRYGLRAKPRVVIVALSGTDDWKGRFPLFARYQGEHPDHDYRDFLEARARERRPPGAPGVFGLPERLHRRLFLPAALGALFGPAHAGGDYEEMTLAGRPVRLRLAHALGLWREIEPERLMEDHRPGIEGLERSIAELRALAAGGGARLVILYLPTMEEVYFPLVAAESEFWGPTPKERVLEKFARLREVVTSLARPAELIDLTAPLGEAARRGWGLYWIHDPRWNRRGNAAVATIVAHRLRHAGREE